ncbi:MAG: type II toxin-antitoxin system HicA family toxin [Paludibacter sp.]|nr:type II toxin-antitoxin system HicA family toxin [Paludibacter sp.]
MKSSELNRLILRNGWKVISQKGSHVKYEKNGTIYIPWKQRGRI